MENSFIEKNHKEEKAHHLTEAAKSFKMALESYNNLSASDQRRLAEAIETVRKNHAKTVGMKEKFDSQRPQLKLYGSASSSAEPLESIDPSNNGRRLTEAVPSSAYYLTPSFVAIGLTCIGFIIFLVHQLLQRRKAPQESPTETEEDECIV